MSSGFALFPITSRAALAIRRTPQVKWAKVRTISTSLVVLRISLLAASPANAAVSSAMIAAAVHICMPE